MKDCKMATFETTRPAPFGAETLYRIVSVIDAGIATLVQWNNKRVTRNALGKLSARELADIGLTRGDVDAMSGPSYRNF
jgi:YD repeat-containing protein